MSISFVESKARTNKLRCSDCSRRIKQGEAVVFELDDCERKSMRNVYGHCCKDTYEKDVIDSQQHPFDLDG